MQGNAGPFHSGNMQHGLQDITPTLSGVTNAGKYMFPGKNYYDYNKMSSLK